MINIPYKLDLKWSRQLQPLEPSMNLNINTNIYENKFKQIILNLCCEEIGHLYSNPETGLALKFKITNNSRLNKDNYNDYISENGIMGPIETSQLEHLKKFVNFDCDYVILNLIDDNEQVEQNKQNKQNEQDRQDGKASLEQFISKWLEDKKTFSSAIPQIYFYGSIYNEKGEFLSNYYVGKKYNSWKHFANMNNISFATNYFKKVLEFLDRVIVYGYVCRNFYASTIGYDLVESVEKETELVFKLTRYTSDTLVPMNGVFYKNLELARCYGKICIGDIIPYYVVEDYYNLNPDWLKRLDKAYSLGLVEIILLLFYNNDTNSAKLHEFILEPSSLESRMQFFHMYKRYNKQQNIQAIMDIALKLKLRYCNVNPMFESILTTIMLSLMDCEYSKILYPNHILVMIKEIEKSNNEFEIIVSPITNAYESSNDLNNIASNKQKQEIIKNDILEITNMNIKKMPINLKYIDENKEIEPSNTKYKKLYLKYKSKYLGLKTKLNKN